MTGSVPYGYSRQGDRLVPDEHEQGVIAMARRWRDEGQCPRDIVRSLAAYGVRQRNGKPFLDMQVIRMIRAEK